ncbi:MAG TPA: HAMP domain-containing methyl-accepting chemotaxis protein [Terriglobales bacterium]|nr:HAMP domain-containing methyl-accepting chemotaxis protein [Terriglobales bacterium]
MKGRLSSTIWILVLANLVAMGAVLWLGYSAGAWARVPLIDAFGASTEAGYRLLGALLVVVVSVGTLFLVLGNRVVKPVKEFADFSEKVVSGDYRARADVDSADDFGLIAENFNRSSEQVSKLVVSQEALEALQCSVTEFLTLTSQIARGDLSLRGKATGDALGNVVDSVNCILDNFTQVLERAHNAAIEVSSSANQILASSRQMSSGAVRQDQEITNTSSAVKEMAVSMKQVSNDAGASAEAARRALDAAEQGHRAVRDTLEGVQGVRASVQGTLGRMQSLRSRSLGIDEKFRVVHEITEQANMLALTSAVEAARAGETGRGFAVIADELRKFAERSRSATNEIGSFLRTVQAETGEAAAALGEGGRELETCAQLVDQARQALESIAVVVRQSAELAQAIALASQRQQGNAESAAQAAEVLSLITRQTLQGTQQSAQIAEQMVKLSQQLNEALSQFRTSPAPAPAPVRSEKAASLRLVAGQGGARS